MLVFLFLFRDCNKVQDKRGAVCEQVTTITLEIQKIKSGTQQLKDSAKREKLKSQVRAPRTESQRLKHK